MTDLNKKIDRFGDVVSRGKQAVEALRSEGGKEGWFDHNDYQVTVRTDSTPHEISFQYEYLRISRKKLND